MKHIIFSVNTGNLTGKKAEDYLEKFLKRFDGSKLIQNNEIIVVSSQSLDSITIIDDPTYSKNDQ